MKETSKKPVTNLLIAGLPPLERAALLRHCETEELEFGEILCKQQERCSSAWFPVTSFISLMASVEGHPPMEITMIGREGMFGTSLLLNLDRTPQQAVVQGAGTALRISGKALRALLPDNPVLLRSIQRYFFLLLVQVTQNSVCTRFHHVEARLARWLLMTDDRAPEDHFQLTHQFLANMLGVQRSAVTLASLLMKQDKLIEYSRGKVSILDRTGLEAIACECYTPA